MAFAFFGYGKNRGNCLFDTLNTLTEHSIYLKLNLSLKELSLDRLDTVDVRKSIVLNRKAY